MKIGILGTRGIPNNYGGFEQFAEFFSVFLAENGHEVYVYNSHTHPYKQNDFKDVKIIHCQDPEHKIGTVGQFIYDLNCILDSRKRNFDIILQLGYTSSAFWYDLHPKNSIVITNMDGLEWKRTKYSKPVQKVLKFAEKFATKKSDFLISDSLGIQSYLEKAYNKESTYIAYGAHPFNNPNEEVLKEYQVEKENYTMVMARFEPENNIEMVLDGVVLNLEDKTPILVIGNHNTKFGEYLKDKFKTFSHIRFMGGIYNIDHLNSLRFYTKLYFHGHSVGGTNPSLLEAMASQTLIAAHNNDFNKGVLKENAFYFSDAQDVKNLLINTKKSDNLHFIQKNYQAIVNDFNWEKINGDYLQLFKQSMEKFNKKLSRR